MLRKKTDFRNPQLDALGLCFYSVSPCPYLHQAWKKKKGKSQILKQNFGDEINSSCFSKRKQLYSSKVNDENWITLAGRRPKELQDVQDRNGIISLILISVQLKASSEMQIF